MINFIINEDVWALYFVEPYDSHLIDRTGKLTLGCTDPISHSVYISKYLDQTLMRKVILHELGHCVMASYNYIGYLSRLVFPWQLIDVEELICNILSLNLSYLQQLTDYILRNKRGV